jgi:hypothetical protein
MNVFSFGDFKCAKCNKSCDFQESGAASRSGNFRLIRAECHGAIADITILLEDALRQRKECPIILFQDETPQLPDSPKMIEAEVEVLPPE